MSCSPPTKKRRCGGRPILVTPINSALCGSATPTSGRGWGRSPWESGRREGHALRAPEASPTLFLLLRGDRLPLRTRRLARELSHPRQQERGRGILRCAAGELLGGREVAARAREPLAIGVRASQRVDRDLARDAERLENAHCFDPDRRRARARRTRCRSALSMCAMANGSELWGEAASDRFANPRPFGPNPRRR